MFSIKKIYFLIGIVTVILVGAIVSYKKSPFVQPRQQTAAIQSPTDQISQPENIKKTVSLIINNGQDNPQKFTSEFRQGMTAFDLLKDQTTQQNLNLETKEYDLGIMIEAIGEQENGQQGKYWLYYVNGQMPQVSADKTALQSADQVEFKFEKSDF